METIDYCTVPQVTLSYSVSNLKTRYKISSSEDASKFIRPFFEKFIYHHEEMWCLLINQAGRVLGVQQIGVGTVNGTVVHQQAIYQAAILSNASGVILVHNHPSGQTFPSSQDRSLTERVKESCKLFDVQLLDHIIITPDGYYSFGDQGDL